MKLLAFDTAMAACSVAVIDTNNALPLAEAFVPMERGHAEALAPMVQDAMAAAGLLFGDLDRIAVTTGPGTFTGVRIGLSLARGLGLSLGLPVVGLDTLSAIAANAGGGTPVLVAADARKEEVYTALIGADGTVLRTPAVVATAHAADGIAGGTLVLGTAAEAVIAASGRNDLLRSKAGDLPAASAFAHLATTRPAPDAMPAPLYLRAPDARPQAGYKPRPAPLRCHVADGAAAALFAEMHGECFDNPWTEDDFARLMAMAGAVAVIAEEGAEPVGFLLARQAADEAEIITVGTRPFAQRRGVASALVTHVSNILAGQRTRQLFLEVAASNTAARALYAACGFADAGTRKGYYQRPAGPREDAIVMRKALEA